MQGETTAAIAFGISKRKVERQERGLKRTRSLEIEKAVARAK